MTPEERKADVAAEQGVPSHASLLAAPGPPGPPSCPVCGRSISAVGGKRPVHQLWCRWTPKSRESPANDAEVAAPNPLRYFRDSLAYLGFSFVILVATVCSTVAIVAATVALVRWLWRLP